MIYVILQTKNIFAWIPLRFEQKKIYVKLFALPTIWIKTPKQLHKINTKN